VQSHTEYLECAWQREHECHWSKLTPLFNHIPNLPYMLVSTGTTATLREEYLNKYGCTRCTDEAVHAIAALGPIVEMGAGKGHWCLALDGAGVDVVAYDSGESDVLGHGDVADKVTRGGVEELSKHAGETIFFVIVQGCFCSCSCSCPCSSLP
jgi:hypothetical protein